MFPFDEFDDPFDDPWMIIHEWDSIQMEDFSLYSDGLVRWEDRRKI